MSRKEHLELKTCNDAITMLKYNTVLTLFDSIAITMLIFPKTPIVNMTAYNTDRQIQETVSSLDMWYGDTVSYMSCFFVFLPYLIKTGMNADTFFHPGQICTSPFAIPDSFKLFGKSKVLCINRDKSKLPTGTLLFLWKLR